MVVPRNSRYDEGGGCVHVGGLEEALEQYVAGAIELPPFFEGEALGEFGESAVFCFPAEHDRLAFAEGY